MFVFCDEDLLIRLVIGCIWDMWCERGCCFYEGFGVLWSDFRCRRKND